MQEITLLLSQTSPLMAALPFVFLTNELHIIPVSTLQAGHHPPAIQITKHYSKLQSEQVQKEFEDVKVLGSAAAEEWLKGLEGLGSERKADAARWERWEAMGGIVKMKNSRSQEHTSKDAANISVPGIPGLPFNSGLPPQQPPTSGFQANQYPLHGLAVPTSNGQQFCQLSQHLPFPNVHNRGGFANNRLQCQIFHSGLTRHDNLAPSISLLGQINQDKKRQWSKSQS